MKQFLQSRNRLVVPVQLDQCGGAAVEGFVMTRFERQSAVVIAKRLLESRRLHHYDGAVVVRFCVVRRCSDGARETFERLIDSVQTADQAPAIAESIGM